MISLAVAARSPWRLSVLGLYQLARGSAEEGSPQGGNHKGGGEE
jgi:hypothetical protein